MSMMLASFIQFSALAKKSNHGSNSGVFAQMCFLLSSEMGSSMGVCVWFSLSLSYLCASIVPSRHMQWFTFPHRLKESVQKYYPCK
eukprot:m.24852 g.24852  ORF g.24852 m.24852 type:complete len:86 (+) comp5701_c0_seq1:204-461(+)